MLVPCDAVTIPAHTHGPSLQCRSRAARAFYDDLFRRINTSAATRVKK